MTEEENILALYKGAGIESVEKNLGEVVIEINAAYCHACKCFLESRSRHDYKTCECDNLMVDGGRDYIRRGFKDLDKIEELSIQRKHIDYDNMSYSDMLELLDAFKIWERIYELIEVEGDGMYKRFAKRWIPEMEKAFKRLDTLDRK